MLAKEFISNLKGSLSWVLFSAVFPVLSDSLGPPLFHLFGQKFGAFFYPTPLCTSYNYASIRPSSRRREREKEHSSFDWRGRFPSFRVMGMCFLRCCCCHRITWGLRYKRTGKIKNRRKKENEEVSVRLWAFWDTCPDGTLSFHTDAHFRVLGCVEFGLRYWREKIANIIASLEVLCIQVFLNLPATIY